MNNCNFPFIHIKNLRVFMCIFLSIGFTPIDSLQAQSKTTIQNGSISNFGYTDKGDSVEFIFGQQQTMKISGVEVVLEKRYHEINQVNLAGDFNGWNPDLIKYQMNRAGGTLFKITLPRISLGKPGELKQFKFVLNHKYWVEPPAQATNTFTGKDGNTNLTLKL